MEAYWQSLFALLIKFSFCSKWGHIPSTGVMSLSCTTKVMLRVLESLLKQSNISLFVRLYFGGMLPCSHLMPLLVVFIASILQTVGINVSLYSFQGKKWPIMSEPFSIIPRLYGMKSFVLNSTRNIVRTVTVRHLKCRSSWFMSCGLT